MKFKTACLAASLAAAGLATTGMAHAQSKVELYGIVDVNVEVYNKAPDGSGGSKTVTGMNSGGMSGSRWGLRGSEDLGNGLRAIFQLEGGFNVASGRFGDSGRLFNRVSMVGLAGDWGQIGLGRQYSPAHGKLMSVLPFGGVNYEAAPYVSPGRADNSLTYNGKFGGLDFGAYYSFRDVNEQVVFDENTTARFGAAASYDFNRDFRIMASYDRFEHQPGYPAVGTLGEVDNWAIGGRAFFGDIKLTALYRNRKTEVGGQPAVKSHFFAVGAGYQINPQTYAGLAYYYDKLRDDNAVSRAALGTNRDSGRWHQIAFLGTYGLSKRTNLYLLVAHARNGAVGLGFGGDGARHHWNGGNQTAGMVGIRHMF